MRKQLVDFIILIILYIFIFYKKWKAKGNDVLFINTIMYIYLSFVLYFTLMPIVTSLPFILNHPYTPMNLIPFVDVISGRGDFIRQIVLNVIMTVPFGFLFPLVKKSKPKLFKTIFYTFLLSFGIEILQPLIDGGRSSDITDLITNVVGGMIGYLIYLIFKPLAFKILDYIKNK